MSESSSFFFSLPKTRERGDGEEEGKKFLAKFSCFPRVLSSLIEMNQQPSKQAEHQLGNENICFCFQIHVRSWNSFYEPRSLTLVARSSC